MAYRIVDRESDGSCDFLPGNIFDTIAKDCHREARVVRVKRNERTEGLERYLNRKARIVKANPGQRKLACEGSGLKPAESRGVCRTKAETTRVGRYQLRFQNVSNGL